MNNICLGENISFDNLVKKNVKEDFKLQVTLPTSYNGEPFEVNVYAGTKYYHTGYDGTTYTSCKMLNSKTVIALIDNHGLNQGLVYVEVIVDIQDTDMPDRNYRLATKSKAEVGTGKYLYLWGGETDTIEASAIEIAAMADFIKGDAYTLTSSDKSDIAAIVLASNIIDSTLSQSGKAADAWATSRAVDNAKNYNVATNKPKINNVELSGNKTAAQLGLVASASGQSLISSAVAAMLSEDSDDIIVKDSEGSMVAFIGASGVWGKEDVTCEPTEGNIISLVSLKNTVNTLSGYKHMYQSSAVYNAANNTLTMGSTEYGNVRNALSAGCGLCIRSSEDTSNSCLPCSIYKAGSVLNFTFISPTDCKICRATDNGSGSYTIERLN